MDMRERILDTARRLTLERGVIPSLNSVAEAAAVSKGGLIHHFPTRAALVEGIAHAALDELDHAMTDAAASGTAAETWLRLSVPSSDDIELFRALAVSHRALEANDGGVVLASGAATARWERLIAVELGDPMRARVVRLVGDGLAMNAVAGLAAEVDVDALVAHLAGPGAGSDAGPGAVPEGGSGVAPGDASRAVSGGESDS